MIRIPGSLTVRTIHGRNGPFNVGRLNTTIGEFVIKDSQLDQFSEGVFQGEFVVLEIRPASYFANGRLVVEVRARVSEMIFSDELLGDVPAEPDDVDPIEEEPQKPESKPAQVAVPDSSSVESNQFGYSAPKEQPAPPAEQTDTDEVLFATLWPLAAHVKLDSTVDRSLLRKQCARLGKLGYVFDSKTQTWARG